MSIGNVGKALIGVAGIASFIGLGVLSSKKGFDNLKNTPVKEMIDDMRPYQVKDKVLRDTLAIKNDARTFDAANFLAMSNKILHKI